MRHRKGSRAVAAAVVGAVAILAMSACIAPPGRSGAAEPPRAMRSAYGNGASSVGADALRALVEDVSSPAQLTDVTEEIVSGTTEDSDGDTLAALQADRVDVAVVRSGRLALAGADSLLALQAPMVVTNDTQAARAAADPTVLTALDGLQRIGLVGLALVPGGVRHPFGYRAAVDSPDDVTGAVINTRWDANADDIVAALGGTVDHSVGDTRKERAADGALRGIETSFGQQGAVDQPAVVTSNVSLYGKFDVVVIRKKAFDSLSADQQHRLRQRATADAAAAVAARPTEASGLTSWCSTSGASSIVVPEAVAAFHAKLDPVVDRMRHDAAAARVIDRMAQLHEGTIDPAGRTCSASVQPTAAIFSLKPTGSQRALDGTWRFYVSPESLLEVGATEQYAYGNAGTWTLHIRNGIAETDQPTGDPCTLRFTFSGHDLLVDWGVNGTNGCNGAMRGTYRLDGDTASFVWIAERDYPVELDQAGFGVMTRVNG